MLHAALIALVSAAGTVCPADAAGWEDRRARLVQRFASAAKAAYLSGHSAERAALEAAVLDGQDDLRACAAAAPRCLARTSRFFAAAAPRFAPGHDLGFAADDLTYYAATTAATAIPAALADPELLRAVSDPARLGEARAYLDRFPFMTLQFRSRHLGTPDQSSARGRLLIVVPGEPERWVQFGYGEEAPYAVWTLAGAAR